MRGLRLTALLVGVVAVIVSVVGFLVWDSKPALLIGQGVFLACVAVLLVAPSASNQDRDPASEPEAS